MKTLKKINFLVIAFLLSSIGLFAQKKQGEELQKSTAVLRDFAAMKENIPAQLMQKAEGIVVIPNLVLPGLALILIILAIKVWWHR